MQHDAGSNVFFKVICSNICTVYKQLSYLKYQNDLFCLNLRKVLMLRNLQIYKVGIYVTFGNKRRGCIIQLININNQLECVLYLCFLFPFPNDPRSY